MRRFKDGIPAFLLLLPWLASCDGDRPSALGQIQREKSLVVATVPFTAPYFYQQQIEMVGSDADLAERIRDKLGGELRLNYVPRNFASLISAVVNGETQLAISALGVSEERRQQIAFSESYCELELSIIENPAHKVIEPDVIKALKVAVREGSTIEGYVQAEFPDSTIVPHNTLDSAVLALRRKEVDMIIDDRVMAAYPLATVTGASLLELRPEVLTRIPIAVGLHKDDQELLSIVNSVVAELNSEGTCQDRLDEESRGRLAEVAARFTDRIERNRMAAAPRSVLIRVSKDADNNFDIYRLANLRFSLRNTTSGKTFQSGRVQFKGPVGSVQVLVPPGSYAVSLPKYGTFGTLQVRVDDADSITVSIRLKKGGAINFARN